MTNSEKKLLEAAAKILRGEHVLNEASGRLTLPPKIKEFLFANFEDQSEMDLWGFEAKQERGAPKVKIGASFPENIRGDIVKRITIFPDGEVRFYGQASNDTYEGSIDDILKLKV